MPALTSSWDPWDPSLTPEEIDAFDLYEYWDNRGLDDSTIPDAETVRAALKAQGFYSD